MLLGVRVIARSNRELASREDLLADANLKLNLEPRRSDPPRRRAARHPHAKSPGGVVTISLGIATSANHVRLSADELLGVADKVLYHAKHSGRNRVELAEASLPTALVG